MDPNSGTLKREVNGAFYSAPGGTQTSDNEATINAFEGATHVQLRSKYRCTRKCTWGGTSAQ